MLTEPSKVFLPVAGVAGASLLVYAMMSGDHAGIALLGALSLVAAFAGVAVAANRDPWPAGDVPVGSVASGSLVAAGDVPAVRPGMQTRPVGGGAWPFLAALAGGLVAVSLVTSPLVAAAGAALGLVVLAGWLTGITAERTGRTINLLPVGIPVVGFFAIASLMFLMSRVLLAVPEAASTWIAMLVAVLVMAVASLFALKPAIQPRTVVASLALAGVLMTAGGFVAAAVGEREIEPHGGGGHAAAVEIEADELLFDLEEISLPANSEAVISFRNREAVPHNIGIYLTEAAVEKIFIGDIVVGPITTTYTFTSPAAGTYFFRCDIHPAMRGTVKVA